MYKKELKTQSVSIRLTNEEHEMLLEKAEGCRSLSEYLRYQVFADIPQKNQRLLEEIRKAQYELHKIGVNINQIVKNNNSRIYKTSDKRELEDSMRRIQELEREIIFQLKIV